MKNFKSRNLIFIATLLLFSYCSSPKIETGAKFQTISLLGDSLFSAAPSENVLKKYELAKSNFYANKQNADNHIWFGRWTAYSGDYLEAIEIYTQGIKQHPDDARFYRHRAHRYISIRKFDLAINDMKKAMTLIENQEDVIEPDGMPNAMNKPISSLHSNIRYHLGLAYYLTNQIEESFETYKIDVALASNDDKIVSSSHWLYMCSRLLEDLESASNVLASINSEMDIIENFDYHKLLLLYKGVIQDTDLLGDNYDLKVADGMAYGIANWYYYNGQTEKAKALLEKILSGEQWASFGYIAAEVDYKTNFK
jgi:tetratricopeptide (TPR) repeat protein